MDDIEYRSLMEEDNNNGMINVDNEKEELEFRYFILKSQYKCLCRCRYISRSTYRHKEDMWKHYLLNTTRVNDMEFLRLFCMRRVTFEMLYILLVKQPGSSDLTKEQLLITLNHYGSSGSGASASAISIMFRIGYGTLINYIHQTESSILKLKNRVINWPDEDERREISTRIQTKHIINNCVMIVDGTLFFLETKPTWNGEDYYTRKGGYAIQALMFCDDNTRIRKVVLGWPGSVHNNRVWLNCDVCMRAKEHFSPRQYCIGNSAFKCSDVMVSAFKKPFRVPMPPIQERFNKVLARPRIKSEQCIGLIKGRFALLKQLRIRVSTRRDLVRLNCKVLVACVLHNLMIQEPYDKRWIDKDEVDEDETMNKSSVSTEAVGGDKRRNDVLNFLRDELVI